MGLHGTSEQTGFAACPPKSPPWLSGCGVLYIWPIPRAIIRVCSAVARLPPLWHFAGAAEIKTPQAASLCYKDRHPGAKP